MCLLARLKEFVRSPLSSYYVGGIRLYFVNGVRGLDIITDRSSFFLGGTLDGQLWHIICGQILDACTGQLTYS